MVGASWSRDELAAMMRAWDDALDVPPHRGFRLLEFMFRRFTQLCGGATDRTVGSMEIKRKYMKNMVDVIAQFNNLHGRNGDGHVDEEYAAGGDGTAATATTTTAAAGVNHGDNTSLVAGSSQQQQQQLRWFEMKRSERKQWFLRLNTKSYKFANIDEETFSSVYKLMQIERVVYGNLALEGDGGDLDGVDGTPAAQVDKPKVSGYPTDTPRSIRVALVRDAAGDWTTQRSSEPGSRPRTAPDFTSYPTVTLTSTRMATEHGTLSLRRDDSAFDRLLASSSGRRGDDVMIDAGSWSDDSDSDESADSDEDDGKDVVNDNSYDWRQAELLASLRFQNQSERAPRSIEQPRQTSSSYGRSDHVGGNDGLHSNQTMSRMRFEQQGQQDLTTDPKLRRALHSLEAQAADLKEILDQEREERQQEERLWEAEKLRRECERQEFTELVAQANSTQGNKRLDQQEDAKLQELRSEVLALIRSEEEERRKEDDAEKIEQEEHDRFLEEIKRDNDARMQFDKVLKSEQAGNATLVELLTQERSERQRKITERMEILQQMKQLQVKGPELQQPSEADGKIPETRNSEVSGGTAMDDMVKALPEESNPPPSQDADTRRPVRRSSAQPVESALSPLRTRSGKVKVKRPLR